MNASWIIPFIILGGVLQTCGAAMNGPVSYGRARRHSSSCRGWGAPDCGRFSGHESIAAPEEDLLTVAL